MNVKYLNSVDELDNLVGLTPKEREDMEIVTQTFPFRANEYYLSLIDWKDRHDPLRRIVLPDPHELKGGGCMDPSCGKDYTKLPGLQHKYARTGLLLLSDLCGGICRFCFRKLAHWYDDYRHHAVHIGDLLPVKMAKMHWLF